MNYLKALIVALLTLVLSIATFDSLAWNQNGHMYFPGPPWETAFAGDTAGSDLVGVLELRNYIIKEGARDRFISFLKRTSLSRKLKLML